MMMSIEDFGIFSGCIDLNIVKSYPRLCYIRPRRPRTKVIRKPRAPVAAVTAELVPVPVPVIVQSTELQPQQPPPVASPTSSIKNEPPVVAAVVGEALAVTVDIAPSEQQEESLVPPDWFPSGWTVWRKTRKYGASTGNRDKYYKDPSGKKFRSIPEVRRHFDQLKLNPLSKHGKRKGRRGNIYQISLSS